MVKLIPLSQSEFTGSWKSDIERYASENVKAKYWEKEGAVHRSRLEHKRILPDGLATPGHFLYSIVNPENGNAVGIVWFFLQKRAKPPTCFIYDLFIFEKHRRKGFGTEALEAVEETVSRKNIRSLALHVFNHNRAAKSLYEKAGFIASGISMMKKVAKHKVK
jgi:RimJ/RimL family protein N-acetyltransferase